MFTSRYILFKNRWMLIKYLKCILALMRSPQEISENNCTRFQFLSDNKALVIMTSEVGSGRFPTACEVHSVGLFSLISCHIYFVLLIIFFSHCLSPLEKTTPNESNYELYARDKHFIALRLVFQIWQILVRFNYVSTLSQMPKNSSGEIKTGTNESVSKSIVCEW